MKEKVFIDSGFWIALLDQKDQNHLIAETSLHPLLKDYSIVLSDFIIFETLTYLNCSIKRHDLALSFLNKTESQGISVLIVDEMVKTEGIKWFKKYSDKYLSITDCTSFVLMEENQIRLYAGFDGHFRQMGFLDIITQIHSSS